MGLSRTSKETILSPLTMMAYRKKWRTDSDKEYEPLLTLRLPHKPHKLLKERLQLLNDTALLRGTPAAETAHGREDRINGGTCGLEPTVAERARDELLRLVGFQILLCDYGGECLFLLLRDVGAPVLHYPRIRIDGRNESVDQLLLAPELGARSDGAVNCADDALIRAVRRVILLHEHENVVDVNVHLTDELQLEHDIVVDILLERADDSPR